MKSNKINRRDFLTKSVLGGAGIIVGGSILANVSEKYLSPQELSNQKTKAMNKRNLGKLEVSEIGFGCMNIAWAYGNAPSKDDSIKLIRAAYDEGVRFFDTAEIYGPHISEQITGEALKSVRNDVKIATKFGFNIDFNTGQFLGGVTSKPTHIKKAVEFMLKRLQTDRIDLLYQHRIDPNIPIEDVAGAVGDLVKEGKVLHFGLSEVGEATIRRAHSEFPVTAVQNEYSFWTRDPEAEVIPTCEELGIGFVPWSPLGMGYLTGKVNETYEFSAGDIRKSLGFPRFTKEALQKNRPIIELLQKVGKRHEATAGQVALAWLMAQKPFIVPIPGTRSIKNMKENTNSVNIKLTKSDISELESEFKKIGVFGDRAPKSLKEGHDLGTSLGTSSKGTNGKTPLRK